MPAWWSQQRITSTVNPSYVEKELGSKRHQDALHRVLAFGDGLTDDTYLDWILERSPRFFLVLNDIGVPEKIFDVIDRSFDDDDLPLSQDALWELNLFGTTSETLDRKFYRQQFCFLIQELEPGGHVDYGHWDVVPVESTVRKASIPTTVQTSDRVFTQDQLYTRKKIPTSGEKGIDRIRFIMHLKNIAALQQQHLVTVWATYTQNDFNYILLNPFCDVTLWHILEDKDLAKHFNVLEKHERRQTLLTWLHCLASALAYLHSRGFFHRSIRPSNISIDHNNVIYLDNYNALRLLDNDASPNPYSGEIYDYAAPEDWQRKPTLHETAPLKTVLPGGGRTSRRLPKAERAEPGSPRPSSTWQESTNRTHSRSQGSSSGSSTNVRPRNALITTFAPMDQTPASPNKHFPSDIFSLTAVLLTMLSYLLGHSSKSFASYRCRLNRKAGRGNAPPDASFHKNPKQVDKWMDMLVKEAGQREKKDQKLWGSVVELVNICRNGITQDSGNRIGADELERKTLQWVEFGIGRRRKCECCEADRSFEESGKPNPVLAAQRDSLLSWSKLSERISSGLYSDEHDPVPTVRPRRSLSKRLTLDRAPELRRSHHARPSIKSGGHLSSFATTEDLPLSPATPSHRQSEIIRSAIRKAVHPTASRYPKPPNSNGFQVVRNCRSAYRVKPNTPAPFPISAGRRNTHPMQPPHRTVQEESFSSIHDGPADNDILEDALPDDEQSSYTLKPRKETRPMATTFPRPPKVSAQDSPLAPTSTDMQPPSPKWCDLSQATAINDVPPYGRDSDEDESIVRGGPDHASTTDTDPRLTRHKSIAASEVWGLGAALEDEAEEEPGGGSESRSSSRTGYSRSSSGETDGEGEQSNILSSDWPLPLGTLTLDWEERAGCWRSQGR